MSASLLWIVNEQWIGLTFTEFVFVGSFVHKGSLVSCLQCFFEREWRLQNLLWQQFQSVFEQADILRDYHRRARSSLGQAEWTWRSRTRRGQWIWVQIGNIQGMLAWGKQATEERCFQSCAFQCVQAPVSWWTRQLGVLYILTQVNKHLNSNCQFGWAVGDVPPAAWCFFTAVQLLRWIGLPRSLSTSSDVYQRLVTAQEFCNLAWSQLSHLFPFSGRMDLIRWKNI